MSDTPRTDALQARQGEAFSQGISGSTILSWVSDYLELSRKLERDLAAVTAERDALREDKERLSWLRKEGEAMTPEDSNLESAEDRLRRRIAGIDAWLREQGVDVKQEQAHTQEGTKERLYWHYGYMVALRDVLKLLKRRWALFEEEADAAIDAARKEAGRG